MAVSTDVAMLFTSPFISFIIEPYLFVRYMFLSIELPIFLSNILFKIFVIDADFSMFSP